MTTVSFGSSHIEFARYPFWPASVRRSPRVDHDLVRSVDPTTAPPEVVLHSGETLFVDAPQRSELEREVARGKLTVERRADVWGLVLEPFLDTEFDPEHHERTVAMLNEIGLPPPRVEELRARFSGPMLRYNSIMWDWIHLGLYDLLQAHVGARMLPWRRAEYRALYWLGMELADLGRGR